MKNIIFFLPLFFLFTACKKNDLQDLKDAQEELLVQQRGALPSVAQMLAEVLVPVDGYVIVSSFGTVTSQDATPNTAINAVFINSEKRHESFGAVQLGGIDLSLDAANNNYMVDGLDVKSQINDFYGKMEPLSISGKGDVSYNQSIYIPKPMRVLSKDVDEIKEGATITWEVDSENKFGIGILLEYGGHLQFHKFIHTEDDGSYTLTRDDVKEILEQGPSSFVDVSVGRGDYRRIGSKDGSHSLGFVSFSVLSMNWYTH